MRRSSVVIGEDIDFEFPLVKRLASRMDEGAVQVSKFCTPNYQNLVDLETCI